MNHLVDCFQRPHLVALFDDSFNRKKPFHSVGSQIWRRSSCGEEAQSPNYIVTHRKEPAENIISNNFCNVTRYTLDSLYTLEQQ